MTFDQWWIKTYEPSFEQMPGVMGKAWREVARAAWEASRIESNKESRNG